MCGLTCRGWATFGFLFLALAVLAFSLIASSQGELNGELQAWYEVQTCKDYSGLLSITSRGVFSSYVMRNQLDLPGQACSFMQADTTTVIWLEEDDGWAVGQPYKPVLLLPAGSYAYVSFSIANAQGGIIVPPTSVQLGPDEYYPWAAEMSSLSTHGTPPFPPPPPTPSPPPPPTPEPPPPPPPPPPSPDPPAQTAQSSLTPPPSPSPPPPVSSPPPPPPSPSPPPPSPYPPPTAASTAFDNCNNACGFASDGDCDDGGTGSEFSICGLGSDCVDCGDRSYQNLCASDDNCLGAISSWQGMVNVHWSNADSAWLTDPDGSSGATTMDSASERLSYCAKFYPSTSIVSEATTVGALLEPGAAWPCSRSWSSGRPCTNSISTSVGGGSWGFCQAGNNNCGYKGVSKSAYLCMSASSSSSGRRRLLLMGPHSTSAVGGGEDEDEGAAASLSAPTPAAGARRLLKGSSSSSSSSSSSGRSSGRSSSSYSSGSSYSSSRSSTGGRTSTSGSGAWGSSSPTSRSYSSSRTTSSGGVTYGGHSSYTAGGRYYGSPGVYDRYTYQYGSRSYVGGSSIVIVGRGAYGCYSCSSCTSCYGCSSRSGCDVYEDSYVSTDQDRYVIELGGPGGSAFTAPPSGSRDWPLGLILWNLTQVTNIDTSLTSSAAYVSFTTDAGDLMEAANGIMGGWVWVLVFVAGLNTYVQLTAGRRELLFSKRSTAGARVERQPFQAKFIKADDCSLCSITSASSSSSSPAAVAPMAPMAPVVATAVPQPHQGMYGGPPPVQAMYAAQPGVVQAYPAQGQWTGSQVVTTTTTTTTTQGAAMGGGAFAGGFFGGAACGNVAMAQPVHPSPPMSPPAYARPSGDGEAVEEDGNVAIAAPERSSGPSELLGELYSRFSSHVRPSAAHGASESKAADHASVSLKDE